MGQVAHLRAQTPQQIYYVHTLLAWVEPGLDIIHQEFYIHTILFLSNILRLLGLHMYTC